MSSVAVSNQPILDTKLVMSATDDNYERLKNTYKRVKLYPQAYNLGVDYPKHDLRDKSNFAPCVSFNTVPSCLGSSAFDDPLEEFPGVQIPPEYSLSDLYSNEKLANKLADSHQDYFSHQDYMDGHKISSPLHKRRTHKSLTDVFKVAENGKIVRVDYPSRPAITNDAFIMTRNRRQWHQLWDQRKNNFTDRLEDKSKWFQYPDILFPQPRTRFSVMSSDGYTPLTKDQRRTEKVLHSKIGHPAIPRTLLCHISGRSHTWVALDWTVRQLAQDTDHIVVIANLPRLAGTSSSLHSRSMSLGRSQSRSRSRLRSELCQGTRSLSAGPRNGDNEAVHDHFIEWASGYTKQSVEDKVNDIFKYIEVILPPELAVKVTVEIILGKTKKIMLDAINCYLPDFCIESTLKWERTDNLVVWKSRILKDVLCTKFSVPVFVVPAKRMFDFEAKMEREMLPEASTVEESPSFKTTSADPTPIPEFKELSLNRTKTEPMKFDSRDSLALNHSATDGNDDTDGFDSNTAVSSNDHLSLKEKMRLARQKHRQNIMKDLADIESDNSLSHSEKKIGSLDGILRETLHFSLELQNMSQEDFDGEPEEFNQLKRIITGSTKAVPNSKKSMLDVLDTPKSEGQRHRRHKRTGSHHGQSSSRPSTHKPRSGQIKFASNVNARDGHQALGNNRVKNQLELPRPSLGQYSFSQNNLTGNDGNRDDEELRRVSSAGSTVTLRKVKSANNAEKVRTSGSLSPSHSHGSPGAPHTHKRKNSGSGFFSLFKSGGSKSRSLSRKNSSGSDSDRIDSSDGKKKRSFFGW